MKCRDTNSPKNAFRNYKYEQTFYQVRISARTVHLQLGLLNICYECHSLSIVQFLLLATKHPKELALLDKFETELRLGRLSTSSTASAKAIDANPNSAYEVTSESTSSGGSSTGTTKSYGGITGRDRRLVTFRTVELLRSLIGSTKWLNAAQLMTLLKGLGKELHAAGGFREPAIGNIVRRIMCAVRQEVANSEMSEVAAKEHLKNGNDTTTADATCMDPIDEDLAQSFQERVNMNNIGAGSTSNFHRASESSSRSPSLVNLLWANPQQLTYTNKSRKKQMISRRKDSFSSVDSNPLDHINYEEDYPQSFYTTRQFLRPAIMEVIQEFMSDLEDLPKNINDQATSHIHTGEVVLTYGRSKTVECVS